MAPSTTPKNRDQERFQHPGQVANDAKSWVQDAGTAATAAAKEVAGSVADKAGEVASRAREVASTVADKAGEVATSIGNKAVEAKSAVGSGMKSLADSIREKTPGAGMLGSASTAMADTLESGGRYLQHHSLGAIGEDLTGVIRKHPVPAIMSGICLGYLIGRALRS